MKPGRNDPCPCGSGKKYKRCCGAAQSGPHPVEAVMENVFNAADSYRDFKRRLIEAGADDYSAQILAAVGLVREYLATREHDQRFAQYLKAASKLVGPLLAAGLSENDVATHLNFRLPFDLLTDGLGAPPAQELLLREGAGLPGEAVGAIRALLAARDRFVEVKPGVPRLLRPVGLAVSAGPARGI